MKRQEGQIIKGGLSLGLANFVKYQSTILTSSQEKEVVINKKMSKEESANRGLNILKRTKYNKKIEGFTLFNQDKEMDLWRPPWKIICDGIMPPEYDSNPTFENKIFRTILRKKQEEQFLRMKLK